MNSKLLWAHTALFTVALIYAANYTIAKIVMDPGYIQPSGFILLRVAGGAIILGLFHLIWVRERVEHKDHLRLALCGLTGIAINQLFFFEGLHRTTPIHASLIMTTTPIIVLILSAVIDKHKILLRQWIGIFLGFAGAVYLIFLTGGSHESATPPSTMWLGDSFVLVNATSYSIYLILVKKLMAKYQAMTVVKWIFTYGLCIVLPVGIFPLLETQFEILGPLEWSSIIYVIICVTIMAYTLNAFAIKTVRPSVVGAYIYLQPLLATAIAISFRGDTLEITHILSGALICFGVALVSIKKGVIWPLAKKN